MAIVTFHGETRLITVNEGDAGHHLDAGVDLYSDWKEWVLVGDNGKYAPAFRTIGGDPLGGVLSAGAYYFLQNQEGWRIRPHEDSHELTIVGNLYPEDPTVPMFVPSLGNYTIAIALERSSLTQLVTIAGDGSGEQDWSAAERAQIRKRLGIDGTLLASATPPELALQASILAEIRKVAIQRGVARSFSLGLGADGLTVAGGLSKDGGAFTALANAIVGKGNQQYVVALTAEEADAADLYFLFTAAGMTPLPLTLQTSG